MSDSTDAILQAAFDLIEKGELEQAQIALAPLLETEPDNPALWWIYAHAVTDSQSGLQAIDRVLQLDPDYPGARELREQADLAQSGSAATATASVQADDDEPGDIDDWEDLQPAVERTAQNRKIGRGLALAAVAVLVIAAGLLLALSDEVDIAFLTALIAPSPPPQIAVISVSTETADSPTAAPTEDAASTPTEINESPTSAPTGDDSPTLAPTKTESPTPAPTETESPAAASETVAFITLVSDAMSNVEIDETGSGFRITELGNTLVFHVCAVPGPQFQTRLGSVMNAVASLDASVPENAEAIAVSLVNCADEDATPRAVGVERDIIQSYANEEIDARDFQRSWQALP